MKTLILAHRGYCQKHLENTLPAFKAALEAGADGIELDVHLSKDGQVIVHHDFDLKRLAQVKGYLADYTLEDLKALDLSGYTLPTLKEVLELIRAFNSGHLKHHFLLNVELKAGSQIYPGIEEKVIDLCLNYLEPGQCVISSFDHEALKTVKAINPQMPIGILTTASLVDPWEYMHKLKAEYYHPNYLTLTKDNLSHMLKHEMHINAYTVNDPKQAKLLLSSGIHSIITDQAETMVKLKNEVNA